MEIGNILTANKNLIITFLFSYNRVVIEGQEWFLDQDEWERARQHCRRHVNEGLAVDSIHQGGVSFKFMKRKQVRLWLRRNMMEQVQEEEQIVIFAGQYHRPLGIPLEEGLKAYCLGTACGLDVREHALTVGIRPPTGILKLKPCKRCYDDSR